MRWQTRAIRFIAGLLLGILVIALGLSTPWAKAVIFERATAWARSRHGLDIRAARFDYRLRSLSVTAEGLTVAELSTPRRPIVRAAHVGLDFAASALRGRLDLDSVRLQDVQIVVDSTTIRPRATARAAGSPLPPFSIGAAHVDDLDLDVAMGDQDEVRLVVRGISSTLQGRGPSTLHGEITAIGGVVVSPGSDAIRVVFDRAGARVALDHHGRVTGSLTASSSVGELRAEGSVPLALDEALDLRYEGDADLEQFHRWWRDAPDWTGRAHLRGDVRGPMRSPDVFYTVSSTDLTWRSLSPAALDASGRVSKRGLVAETFALSSSEATLQGRGTLAFHADQPSEFSARWTNVGADLVAGLFSRALAHQSRTALSGSAQLAWNGLTPRLGTIAGHVDATAATAAPDDTASGRIAADGRAGRWQIDYRQALDGDAAAALRADVDVDPELLDHSTVRGTLSIHGQDVGATLAQLQRLGLPVRTATTVASERVAFDGTIDGTLGAPRLMGTIAAAGVRVGAIDAVRLSGTVTLDAQAVSLSPLDLESFGNRATLRGALPWRSGSGQGDFEIHIEDMAQLAHTLPDTWRPRGTVTASGAWTGSMRNLAVTSRLSGSALAVNGVAFDTATARASLAEGRIVIDDVRATQPGGVLSGSGSWHLADATMTADLEGTALSLDVLGTAEDGTLSRRGQLADVAFTARVTGTARRPDGTLTVEVGAADIEGRTLGSLTARAEAMEGVALLSAGAPAHGATLTARLTLDESWPFEGRLAFTDADVGGLARLAGVSDTVLDRVDASIDATIEATGTVRDVRTTDATLSVTKLEGTIREQSLALAQAGRVHLQDERLRVDEPMQLTWGSSRLTLHQASASPGPAGVAVSLDVLLGDISARVPEILPEGVEVAGTVTAEILVGDRVADIRPTGQVSLALTSVTRSGQELVRDTTTLVDVDTATLRVRELRGTVLGGPVEARGTVPVAWLSGEPTDERLVAAGPATFWLKSGAAVGAVLAMLWDDAPVASGTVNLTIEGSAEFPRLDAVRATLRDETSDIAVGGVALNAQRPTELRVERGLLHVDQFEWHGPQSTFTASGTVALTEGLDGRLTLDGNGSLAPLTLFTPARIDGRGMFDLELSGSPGQRKVLGTIGIEDGSLVVQSWRMALAGWSGNIVLERDRIDVGELRGQFNGGEATLQGSVPIGPGTAAPQSLAVNVRGAFFDLPRGLRSQLDAGLEWIHAAGSARLSGKVTITAPTYREPATEIARIAALLIDRSGGSPVELPATLAATELDVALSTEGPLAITNSVARIELLPDLQLTGTISRPALEGQVAVAEDGRIQFGGRQYRLRESRLEFSPERGLMPRLDVSGETRVADHDVFLKLSGTADQIETALSSDPPLGERDLQSLLVTGQRQTIGETGAESDQAAVGAVSGDVLGLVGQFVGIDAVTVSTTDDLSLVSSDVDPALRLTVSKRLGRRFELVLSDNLDDDELTWVIIYRPRPGLEFRAVSRDNVEYSGEFRQEIFFGPGVSAPRAPPRPRVATERVAEVTISGAPGFAAADVLSATSLQAGDAFDFARWLEDRERIARHYQQHGYFSARVVPTRRPLDAEGGQRRVSLDYRVTRGPHTVLSVIGYACPQEVEERLRQVWSDSVLVNLLEDDLVRVMREHLIAIGFLRATVAAEVDHSQPDRVTATIRVEPGIRSTDRRLAFSGNTVLSSEDLLAVARADAGLESPWLDPAPLFEVLQAAYADRGYLAMTAIADAIEFAGAEATLPIRIVEGPQARIASLEVTGGDPVALSAAANLGVGATYVAGRERTARIALERYYRNLGHRDVVVDLRSTVNPAEGRVDVAVTIHEGPRYVVRAVRTTGVQSTREETVERATRIEPGSPASPAVADATRRQLYDIGTFRSADVAFVPVEGAVTASTVPVDAVVTLQESKRFLLLYGIEATNQYQPLFDQRLTSGGVAADLRDRNFLGRGWTLGAGLRYEPSFRSARLLASVPRLGSRRIRTNLYVNSSSEDRARTERVVFRDDETSVSLEQRWRVRTPVEIAWGYGFNHRDLRFLDAASGENLFNFKGYLAGPVGAVVVDRRDNLFDARRGWLFSTSSVWGLRPLGSDFDYLRTTVRASHYQPVGPLTLASNVRWGNLHSFGGRPPLSVLDLFYTAGGTQTVRGYAQDSLSAYHLLDSPVGGTKLVVFNEEVRFPLFWLLSGVGFIDAGNTFAEETGIVFRDLAVGAGFGLRIRTPLAPIRIDLGFPVSTSDRGSARWHFSIGQIF